MATRLRHFRARREAAGIASASELAFDLMEPTFTLGPFRLIRRIGHGGMGSVWRAVHVHQNHPVAIKVMTADKAREDRFRNSFYEEVRAVARLHHPNIIRVFDCGEISEGLARMTDGAMVAESPYLVMELAQSTLAQIDHEQLTWPMVRSILLHILDALAYSHARGLIHRDLKPDNILFVSQTEGGQLKLSDFGLAYAVDSSNGLRAEDHIVSGTPRYMAPEQIRGRLRDQGPWTDLYNLGGMAYWLTSGRAPFTGDSVDEVLRGHLAEPRPPLQPQIEVPRGFDEWARRLIARDPANRFRRAADAAHGLAKLEGHSGGGTLSFTAHTDSDDTVEMTIVDELDATHILHETLTQAEMLVGELTSGAEGFDEAIPEFPETWRHRRKVDPPEMIGVGLGLYGIREIPLVGRHHERDRLWNALSDARDMRTPHAVILSGPTGMGKTTLAAWLAERAHEVGAVDVLKALHSPISGPSHGLAGMFAEYMRCVDLPGGQLLEHIREFFGGAGEGLDEDTLHQCLATTALLVPAVDPNFDEGRLPIRFASREQRYRVWAQLLEKLAERRPLLMILDDVQWGADALRFAHYLFDQADQVRLPVLIVVTARDDILARRCQEGELLDELGSRGLAHRMELGPLGEEAHRKLVQNLLGLEKSLADDVVRRTAGNPLFAIQLVGDWVERGILDIGGDGFRLVEGAEAPLPGDVSQLLVGRLEQVVGHGIDEPAPGLLALELAVTLGRQVDEFEWRRLCQLADVEVPSRLVDSMVARSLAHTDERGWAFVHGAMRETLEEIARRNGRLTNHHRLCARLLQKLYDDSRGAVAPRIARHLLIAGDFGEALSPLLDAIRHYRITHDLEEGHRFYEAYLEALEHLDVDDEDRRVVEGELEYANLLQRGVRLEEAEEFLQRCHRRCRDHGWEVLLAKTLLRRAENARMSSHLDDAEEYIRKALSLYRQLEDPAGVGRSLRMLGWVYKWKSDFEPARRYLVEAERQLRVLDEPDDHTSCLFYLAAIHVGLKDFERAAEYAVQAKESFEKLGNIKAVAYCLNSLGECHRFQGDLETAAHYYEEAVALGDRLGMDRDMATYFNVGAVHMMQGDFQIARPYFEEALRRARMEDRPGFLAIGHVGMFANAAGLGLFDEFDEHIGQAEYNLNRTTMVDRDIPLTCELAADLAMQAGDPERARRALGIAIDQWEAMNNEERLAAVREKLQTL